MSMVSMMSLIPIGMPSIGESGLPARQRFVERSAAVLAAARFSVTKAPIFGSHASSWAMQRSRNARGESFPLAKSAVAGRNGCIRGFVAFVGSVPLLCIAYDLAFPREYSAVKLAPSSRAVGCRETPVLPDGLWRSDPQAVGRTTFPWLASSLGLSPRTIAVRPRRFSPSPHSEGRATRGVWKNGPVRAAGPAGRPSRRAFGAPQDEAEVGPTPLLAPEPPFRAN